MQKLGTTQLHLIKTKYYLVSNGIENVKDFEFQVKECNLYSVIDPITQLKKKWAEERLTLTGNFKSMTVGAFLGIDFFHHKVGKNNIYWARMVLTHIMNALVGIRFSSYPLS